MARDHRFPSHDRAFDEHDEEGDPRYPALAAGKRTLTSRIPVILRAAMAGEIAPEAPARLDRALGSSGRPLPEELRTRLERSLRADLSAVRVHTGTESADAARAVQAKAFTVGQDIHFGPGRFDPGSAAGQQLIAHEVAHTVQQGHASVPAARALEVSSPSDSFEVDAERFAGEFIATDSDRTVEFPALARNGAGTARAMLQRELDADQKKEWDANKGDELVRDLKVQASMWKSFRQAPATHDGMPGKDVAALVDKIKDLFAKDPAFRQHFADKVSGENAMLREMASINHLDCIKLEEIGVAKHVKPVHKWVMTASASGDPLKGALQVSSVNISYSNSLGWAWSRGLEGNLFSFGVSFGAEAEYKDGEPKAKGKGGASVGPSTVSINGTADAAHPAYWGYDNLPGPIAIASGPSGGGQLFGDGGKFSTGSQINLVGTGGPQSPLVFRDFEGDAKRESPKSPKDALKKPGFSISIASIAGGILGPDGKGVQIATAEPVPELVPMSREWVTFIRGFETGEDQVPAAEIDGPLSRIKTKIDQHRELVEANKEILRDEFHIDQSFRLTVQVEGYASRRWATAKSDAERVKLNQELSTRRAQTVTAACYAQFGADHEYSFAGKGAAVNLGVDIVAPEAGNEEALERWIEREVERTKKQFPNMDEKEIRESLERRLGKSSNEQSVRMVHVKVSWVGYAIRWGAPNQTPAPRTIPDQGNDGAGGGGGHEGAGGQEGSGDGSGGQPGNRREGQGGV